MIVGNFSQLGEGGWRWGEGGFFRWEKFVQADHENETAVTGETLSKRSSEEEEEDNANDNNKEEEEEDKADHENETAVQVRLSQSELCSTHFSHSNVN